MPKTIDLRGNEQICNRKHAMQYAAVKGYDMFIFGNTVEPCEVDKSTKNESVVGNPLFTIVESQDLMRERAYRLLDEAVFALYEYAGSLEIGPERTKAFAVYQAARLAPRAN